MYKEDLALNNLQKLIYHKNQPTNQPIKNSMLNILSYLFEYKKAIQKKREFTLRCGTRPYEWGTQCLEKKRN